MRIEPAAAVRGDVRVPGDKSISHRALLVGAVANGESEVRGFGASADTLAAADAMRSLGATVESSGETVHIQGVGLGNLEPPDDPIDCRNAGTLIRLLSASSPASRAGSS